VRRTSDISRCSPVHKPLGITRIGGDRNIQRFAFGVWCNR
jgi:hypothetical protein